MHEDINIAIGNVRRRLQSINDFQQTLVITKNIDVRKYLSTVEYNFKSYVIKLKNAFYGKIM